MILRADKIVKYYGKRAVVKGVSVEVKQGEIVGLLGLHIAPVTKPATSPPNRRFGHPSRAYVSNPRKTGIRKEGTIPSNVVHNISVRKLPHESAVFGTLRAGASRTGEMTNRTTVLVSDRSTGMFEVAKTSFRFGCISTANR